MKIVPLPQTEEARRAEEEARAEAARRAEEQERDV